ncbi:MAG TPA: hypothetical protein VF498_17410 [Anaerolineales bacterium]
MHIEDGQLRAILDGEKPGEAQAGHLAGCLACQQRLAALRTRATRMDERLAFLSPQAGEELPAGAPSGRYALTRFKSKLSNDKETNMFNRLFTTRTRILWAGVAAALILALVFSFPPVGAWAGQFLGLFRVQQVAVVPVDYSGMQSLAGNSALGQQIGQLLSNSRTMTKKPGNPKTAADAAQASQLSGFTVRLPASESSAPQLLVQGGSAFQFVVNRAQAQALLNEAGRSDLVLPASLDGAKISVKIPSGVTASYGDCPQPSSDEGMSLKGSTGRRYANCIVLAEIPSPTVDTPPDVDFKQLAEIGLQFTGMSAEQASQFSQTVDWTSSLVIPIPKNAATYQQVSVDGVTGTLIQRPVDDAPQYALIWVKNGTIYAISSLGSDSARAIDMANSLK